MTDDELITAFAKGAAPYIRDCVMDTVCKSMIVSPELAQQIATAVRMLHEIPESENRSGVPTTTSSPKILNIKRDDEGNFVPVYAESKI